MGTPLRRARERQQGHGHARHAAARLTRTRTRTRTLNLTRTLTLTLTVALTLTRHAFGADNLLLYVFETHLKVPLANRCMSYRLMHLHCLLPTSIGNCADTARTRGYGDGTFVTHGHMNRLLRKHDTHISEREGAAIVRRRLPVGY